MPVLVTGAEAGLGASVIQQLRRSGGELRAYLDATSCTGADVDRLRAAGCKVALGELDDEAHLEAALEQVHTVAHCWTGPLHDPAQQVEAAATLASAALGAHVRRLIWIRELAAPQDNPYLEAGAQIAALFEELPLETVLLWSALRYGADDPFTTRLISGWLPAAVDLATPHAPIANDDVARAIAAADRQRGGRELHVRLALIGPQIMMLGEFVDRLSTIYEQVQRPAAPGPAPAWLGDWLSRPAIAPPEDVTGPVLRVAQATARVPTR